MVSLTLSIPDDVRKKMDEFPELNWSQVARAAIVQKIKELEFLREFTRESGLTGEDAIALGRKLNEKAARAYSSKKE